MIPQRRRFVNRKFSIVEQNGNVPKQAHYFIYSRKGMTASQVLKAKRSRWGIENQLHWVLDMQFLEAESRAGAGNSAKHRNVIRHWAYDLLKSKPLCAAALSISGSKVCSINLSWTKSSAPLSAHDLFPHSITLLSGKNPLVFSNIFRYNGKIKKKKNGRSPYG